jgi:hypothetical protein
MTRKGATVARERPTASDVSQMPTALDGRPRHGGSDRPDTLTQAQAQAQAQALRRCAPLTRADFKARGRQVQQRTLSLRQILARDAAGSGTSM